MKKISSKRFYMVRAVARMLIGGGGGGVEGVYSCFAQQISFQIDPI